MGHRAADISAPRWGVTSVPGATVEVGSALRSPAWTPPDLSAEAATVGDQITAGSTRAMVCCRRRSTAR
jgi:hypothetical protein